MQNTSTQQERVTFCWKFEARLVPKTCIAQNIKLAPSSCVTRNVRPVPKTCVAQNIKLVSSSYLTKTVSLVPNICLAQNIKLVPSSCFTQNVWSSYPLSCRKSAGPPKPNQHMQGVPGECARLRENVP